MKAGSLHFKVPSDPDCCGAPHTVCHPETQVQRIDPAHAVAPGPHMMNSDPLAQDFTVAGDVLTAAINVCRLNRRPLGGCTGFALLRGEDASEAGSATVIPLYSGPGAGEPLHAYGEPLHAYGGTGLTAVMEVYSIEACLPWRSNADEQITQSDG